MTPVAPTTTALLLPVGDDLYALPLAWAREVVAAPTVACLVTAPSVVLGLFNLRGQIVPLLDTAALLGIGAIGAISYAVVVDGPQGPAGLATTGFPQRAGLGQRAGESTLPGTIGLYHVGEQIAVLLDPAALLTPEAVSGLELRADLATVAVG